VRAVVDSNVLLSGLFWHGPPHRLLEQIRNGRLALVSSPGLFAELADVLGRPKFQAILVRTGIRAEAALAELSQLSEIIDPPPLPAPVSRDPDDDAVLALAVAGQVDLVISGDDDLLTLGSHAGIPILDVLTAIAKLSS
jgi:putative PIN family toxin of toxin-antitoxin system